MENDTIVKNVKQHMTAICYKKGVDVLNKEELKKYIYAGITGCVIIGFGILLYFIIQKVEAIQQVIHTIIGILMPIIYGLVIAYLTIPIYNYFMKKIIPFLQKKLMSEKRVLFLGKVFSITLTIVLAIAVVAGLIAMVIPQVLESLTSIIQMAPDSYRNFIDWVQQIAEDNPELKNLIISSDMTSNMNDWFNSFLMPNIQKLLNGITTGILLSISNVVNLIKNIIIGIIVAIYVLNSKDTFVAQGKKIVYSAMKEEHAKLVIEEVRFIHKMFGGFISGKLLDSLIIGIICFIVMTILKMPYVMLISVIIGVTNIIPFFGPFIGAIPTALFILMESPIQCIYFLIFILLLQQFDGNILGPKILGDSTGISSFWVLFSILLFGGLFGFVGMIIGVPTFAVIYDIISRLVNHGLRKKKMSINTEDYKEL